MIIEAGTWYTSPDKDAVLFKIDLSSSLFSRKELIRITASETAVHVEWNSLYVSPLGFKSEDFEKLGRWVAFRMQQNERRPLIESIGTPVVDITFEKAVSSDNVGLSADVNAALFAEEEAEMVGEYCLEMLANKRERRIIEHRIKTLKEDTIRK